MPTRKEVEAKWAPFKTIKIFVLIFRKGQEVSNQYKHVFRSNDHLTDNPGTFGGNNFKANYLENNVCIFYIQNILLFI